MKKNKKGNLVVATRLQFLETALRVLHDHPDDFNERSIALLTDPAVLARNVHHPLTYLTLAKFDLVVIPLFGSLRTIKKNWVRKRASRVLLEVLIGIDLLLGFSRRQNHEELIRILLTALDLRELKILFEVLNPFDPSCFEIIPEIEFIGISHTQGGFLINNLNSSRKSVFSNNVRTCRQHSRPRNRPVRLFLHEALIDRLGLEHSEKHPIKELAPLSTSYLNEVEKLYSNHNHAFGNRKFALLISRPSSTNSEDTQCPNEKIKKRMLREIRAELESLGLKPVYLPHPTERTRLTDNLDFVLAPGWRVASKIHYLILISQAEIVISFGTQIEEESFLLGKKSIVYRIDWEGFESRFVEQGRSYFSKSPNDLRLLLSEIL